MIRSYVRPGQFRETIQLGLVPLLLCALVLAAGCGPEAKKPRGELQTEEVAPPIDEMLTTEFDEKGRTRRAQVSGVLPPGFPTDLPLYVPSSIVDLGASAGGWRYVTLFAPEPEHRVSTQMKLLVGQGGWSTQDGVTWSNGSRSVKLRFSDAAAGTEIRVEYRPQG